MHIRFPRSFGTLFAALALVSSSALFAQSAVMADADPAIEARKALILENLKTQFPRLAEMNASMGELKPTPYAGLDEGSFLFTQPAQPGQQQGPMQGVQKFYVSRDNKALIMLTAEPIDVSLSVEQLAVKKANMEAERSKAEADKLKADAEKSKAVMPKLAAATKGMPVRGKATAPVTIVEYSDFQCPYCTRGFQTVEALLKKYPDDVKFIFMHYPLGFHPWAKPGAIAANCAALQNADAYWAVHDGYFGNQGAITLENVTAKAREFMAGKKIDLDKWAVCAENKDSAEYKAADAAVDASMKSGTELGVTGTPGFFVNGRFVNGAQPPEAFDALIADAKKDAAPVAKTTGKKSGKKSDKTN